MYFDSVITILESFVKNIVTQMSKHMHKDVHHGVICNSKQLKIT